MRAATTETRDRPGRRRASPGATFQAAIASGHEDPLADPDGAAAVRMQFPPRSGSAGASARPRPRLLLYQLDQSRRRFCRASWAGRCDARSHRPRSGAPPSGNSSGVRPRKYPRGSRRRPRPGRNDLAAARRQCLSRFAFGLHLRRCRTSRAIEEPDPHRALHRLLATSVGERKTSADRCLRRNRCAFECR